MTLPAPAAVVDVPGEGGVIRIRRHGNPRGPRLILSHGNGFAIDGYAAFWSRFLAGFDVILFDARNHGWNELSDPAAHDYAHMAADLERVRAAAAAEFGAKATAGLFHSMSAQAAMLAALDIGWRFEALVLFDPPNNPPPGHSVRAPMERYLRMLVGWASGRRDTFADIAQLAAVYAATRAGRNWAEGAPLAVARAVLRQASEGGWQLRCPRALEAAMYAQGIALDLWPPAGAFPGPIRLIGADPERERPDPTALSNRALAGEGLYDYVALPGSGHLLQLEQPAACAEAVIDFLERCDLY
ncbi:MAG: alpha/beta hydrolase [Alphaproteobacteria bacterium]|nr:alpha/beta hydrolase [Alphaproteobacteria bacterium]